MLQNFQCVAYLSYKITKASYVFLLQSNLCQNTSVYVTDVGLTCPRGNLFKYHTKVNSTHAPPPHTHAHTHTHFFLLLFFFSQCCFHSIRCIVGPICLIIENEGDISCLRSQWEEARETIGLGELGNWNGVFDQFLWDAFVIVGEKGSLTLRSHIWSLPIPAGFPFWLKLNVLCTKCYSCYL